MIIERAFHRFGVSLPNVIDLKGVELSWKGSATLFAPSGTGKTTLFRLLAGWYEVNSLSNCVWEPNVNSYQAVRFVGGHRGLLPWKSVQQNIEFQFPDLPYDRLCEVLRKVCLNSEVLELYPYQLSFGMYQRVELVVAILSKPSILLLDEFYSSIGDDQKESVKAFISSQRADLVTWIVAHEEKLRDWIGGPQFSFIMDSQTVCGIKQL